MSKIKVGDKVEIRDYSASSLILNGEVICSNGWNIRKKPQVALVIATGCKLPFGKDYDSKNMDINDTIVHIPSDGRTLFIRSKYLKIERKTVLRKKKASEIVKWLEDNEYWFNHKNDRWVRGIGDREIVWTSCFVFKNCGDSFDEIPHCEHTEWYEEIEI